MVCTWGAVCLGGAEFWSSCCGKHCKNQQQHPSMTLLPVPACMLSQCPRWSQIAAYMTKMRQSRLERAAYKQDDEIVGIVGLYLSVTLGVLMLAALANLPS